MASEAETMRNLYLDAIKKVLKGQEYQIGTRRLTRANLSELQQHYIYWNDQFKNETSGGIRVQRIVHRD